MIPYGWDLPRIHRQLFQLIASRSKFRLRRGASRICSPRRLLATSMTIVFFALYVASVFFILSERRAADPERLRLWLSGGMVLYSLYHLLRCVWSQSTDDLELSDAEKLWLGGAPIHRSSVAVYHIGTLLLPTILKTLLLALILFQDVKHPELLILGIGSSLLLLETIRLMIASWARGLSTSRYRQFRFALTLVTFCAVVQVISRVVSQTPVGSGFFLYVLNSFHAVGQLASSDLVQWFSLPWIPGAYLSVTQSVQGLTGLQILASVAVLPLAVWILVQVDLRSLQNQHRMEQQRLTMGRYKSRSVESKVVGLEFRSQNGFWTYDRLFGSNRPSWFHEIAALMSRQWVSITRSRTTIFLSVAIPMLLSLSPLIQGQMPEHWFYVVGGLALCTMVLAPISFRIDFRRDLRRMLLLRSLPVKPVSMVIGQIALPVAITWAFQWVTILIAALATNTSWEQVLLWTTMLAALVVFTFAVENALFLAYPHHPSNQGLGMMIRAKLTFLGKGAMLTLGFAGLLFWATLCRAILPPSLAEPTFIGGAILASWTMAALAIAVTAVCWRRFDVGSDVPPV